MDRMIPRYTYAHRVPTEFVTGFVFEAEPVKAGTFMKD